ncbi:hypothetical protein O1611_g2907 [Lasiodiplodia mahajangana]|uniref:Uncharacterized protein n=1 Tax=Lasiodiplodia mahajangana TaxID=1108764 RepID=A0ACC2JTR3_9PEZI|nr:hypothetical protein O1611_g2907 [Lasiodiplodia mahajangana]
MVLSALSSTYQLYKQDTDSVAGWLASTAKSLGFSANLSGASASTSKPSGGGRLKGKARAQAKKQAAAQKRPTPSTGPKYIINIKDFVPLAEYVAAKAAPVPDTVRTTIDRVIAARSGFSSKLEKHGKAISELSDAKHQYFIAVLEKVREVLKPHMPVNNVKLATTDEEKLSNRFAGLDVYEPSQEFLDAPVIERPAKVQEDNAVYEAETEVSFEHAFFAMTTAVNDMNRIRYRIQWIWTNYRAGIFDLTAAAIATNTAIELVRNMLEDILPLLNRHGGAGEMLKHFYVYQCLVNGWSDDDLFSSGAEDNFNYETYHIGNQTYFTTYRLMEAFIGVVEPGQVPLYKDGMFGFYDPSSNRSSKTGFEKFCDDRALLMPFFTELMTAIRAAHGWPVKDAFLHGIEELSKTRQVPFYAIFAAQIFLDITYELGKDIERPFHTLVTHTTFMDNDIKTHFDFHANLKINTWPASNDQVIRALQRDIQWLGTDPLRAAQTKFYERAGMEVPEQESHRLYRMSPVTCGLFLYHYRTRYRDIGLGVADVWGSIQYCEHLYNALHHEGLLDGQWPDMDIVVTNLGEGSFFVGGELPATPPNYFKKFSLQMGTSAAAMMKGRRKKTPLESKAGPRGLKESSPVLSMFKTRYVEDSRQIDFTPEQVSQIIELSLFEQEEGSWDDGVFSMGQIEDPKKLQEKKKKLQEQKNKGRSAAPKSGNMPVDQLIKPLVFALHVEALEYSYPYLNMHRWCWRLLRAVKNSSDSILTQLYTPAYLDKECQLPWIVGWIFMAASGLEGGISDRRPMQKAAEAMNVFFGSGASDMVCKMVLGEQLGMPVEFESDDE